MLAATNRSHSPSRPSIRSAACKLTDHRGHTNAHGGHRGTAVVGGPQFIPVGPAGGRGLGGVDVGDTAAFGEGAGIDGDRVTTGRCELFAKPLVLLLFRVQGANQCDGRH